MKVSKIQLKINNAEGYNWVHFCYAPTEVKEAFDKYVNRDNQISNYWIEGWTLKEFGMVYPDDFNGFLMLKETIQEKYKNLYPDLYLKSTTDSQGWLRVWYTNNMVEELAKRGK